MSAHPRLIDMAQAMKDAAGPTPYLCRPLVPEDVVVTITGTRGDSKTWLALSLAAAVANGTKLAGLKECEQAPALLIDGENGKRIMGKRFELLGLDAGAFHVADGLGLRLPHDINVVRDLVTVTESKLVILDSLRRLAPGARENDSDDMAPIYAGLAELSREQHCAVVVLHHKSSKRDAPDSRGTSAIEDQSDLFFVLERVAADPESKTRRRLRNTKNRVDEEPDPIWLDFRVIAGRMTVSDAKPFEGSAYRPRLVRDRLMSAILGHLDGGCSATGAPRGTTLHCTHPQIAESVGRGPKDGSTRNAVAELLTNEWISHDDSEPKRYTITDAGREEAKRHREEAQRQAAETEAPAESNGYRTTEQQEQETMIRSAS